MHHPSVVQRALFPLASVYGAAVKVRTSLYERGWLSSRKLPCRVISVGNLTTGGTGKTPVVIALADWLTASGKRVGVLSRGYRRESRAKHVLVSDGRQVLAGPAEAGDEPYLIARRCPGVVVAVGADRYRLGGWVLERFPLDCVLLDDGFQHLALRRDVDVLLVDASDPEGLQALLPAGRLREPIAAAARAHALLLTRADAPTGVGEVRSAMAAANLPTQPVRVRFTAEGLVHGTTGKVADMDFAKGRTAMMVSGIANASSFRLLVEGLGLRVLDDLRFPDHHAYTRADLNRIAESASRCSADLIVTTEKDTVKLATLVPQDARLGAVRLRTEFMDSKEELEKLILGEC
jgi:tetraacyldisaccharide 4'-kinase